MYIKPCVYDKLYRWTDVQFSVAALNRWVWKLALLRWSHTDESDCAPSSCDMSLKHLFPVRIPTIRLSLMKPVNRRTAPNTRLRIPQSSQTRLDFRSFLLIYATVIRRVMNSSAPKLSDLWRGLRILRVWTCCPRLWAWRLAFFSSRLTKSPCNLIAVIGNKTESDVFAHLWWEEWYITKSWWSESRAGRLYG